MVVRKKRKTRAKKPSTRRKARTTVKRRVKAKKTARRAARPKAKKATKRKGGKRSSGLTKMTYTLSAELQAIVGSKSATRPEVVKKLWAYIKSRKCQDAKNRRMIVPDAKLAHVLGSRPVDMMKIAGLLSKHLK